MNVLIGSAETETAVHTIIVHNNDDDVDDDNNRHKKYNNNTYIRQISSQQRHFQITV